MPIHTLFLVLTLCAAATTTPGYVDPDASMACDELWNALNDPDNKISDELYFRGVAAVETCDLAAERARLDDKGADNQPEFNWDEETWEE